MRNQATHLCLIPALLLVLCCGSGTADETDRNLEKSSPSSEVAEYEKEVADTYTGKLDKMPRFAEVKDLGKGARLHYVIVADTNDGKIGRAASIDGQLVIHYLLKPVFDHGQLGYGRIFWGRSVNRRDILSYLRRLPVNRDDTILFYFTGHGGVNRHRHHYLKMSIGDVLLRREVRRIIMAKRPRLGILLTDCCATYNRPPKGGGYGSYVELKPNWDVVSPLFFGPAGLVDVTAAKPGTPAGCRSDVGSYFTNALMYTATCTPNVPVTWYNYIGFADYLVRKVHDSNQTAYAFYLGGWPRPLRFVATKGEKNADLIVAPLPTIIAIPSVKTSSDLPPLPRKLEDTPWGTGGKMPPSK